MNEIKWKPAPRTDRPLRIALVHSFYRSDQPSGENSVVEQQANALRRRGHEVMVFAERTDSLSTSRLYPLLTATTVASGRGRNPLRALKAFAPDIVHIHNLFPNYGRRWVARWNGPLVATMHNYRPLCPAGTFFRNGGICTDCLDKRSAVPSIVHRCYKNSRLKTLPLAASTKFDRDPVLRRADRVIVLNESMLDLYGQAGVPHDRLALLSNFLAPRPQGVGGDYWLYVGRVSVEKGIAEVAKDWPGERMLLIVGEGDLRHQIEAESPANVRVLGPQSASEVQRLMSGALGLIFPSKWLEGFPMVYLEAISVGTPVLAWPASAVGQLVASEGTGLISESLAEDLATAEQRFPHMRGHCRTVFSDRYTESTWMASLEEIYRKEISQRDAAPNEANEQLDTNN